MGSILARDSPDPWVLLLLCSVTSLSFVGLCGLSPVPRSHHCRRSHLLLPPLRFHLPHPQRLTCDSPCYRRGPRKELSPDY